MISKAQATLLTSVLLLSALGVSLDACGRQGVLEQPAPLFGERAKEDYAGKQAAKAAQNAGNVTGPVPAADQPDPDADNAPRTPRDLKAPSQDNAPISKEPILGAPDPNGPTPSMTPPGAR